MRLLDRYMGQAVVASTAVVMAVLLSLYFFSTFVEEVGDVGQGDYTVLHALQFTVLLMPRLAYELFPLAALLGSLLGLGTLAGSNELTVIRAAGVSVGRIVFSVFKVGLVMIAVVGLLGEAVAPHAEKYARNLRAEALSEQFSVNTDFGLWAREGDTFVNIRRLLPDGLLSQVFLYELGPDGQLLEATVARRAVHRNGAWQLQDIQRSRFHQDRVERVREERAPWRSSLTPEALKVVSIPPEKLSIWDLWGHIGYLKENGLDAKRYEVSMWNRAAVPFATAGMVLLAVPFVFGSMRSVGVGHRVMVGSLLGIGFYLLNAVFTRAGMVYGLPPAVAALLPTGILYLSWWLLMRRVT